MGFFSALNSSNLDRLKSLWSGLPKATLKVWEGLQKIFSMEKNYQAYRKKLASISPAIPYLGMISKDLFMLEEGSPSVLTETFKDMQVELVNFSKLRMIYFMIQKFQVLHRMSLPLSCCRNFSQQR